jgi:hypothetical protein
MDQEVTTDDSIMVESVTDFTTEMNIVDETTMMTPVDEQVNPAFRHHGDESEAPEVEDSFATNWEQKEIILGLDGKDDNCFDMSDTAQRFITVISRILVTTTRYETVTVKGAENSLLFKAAGGCLPTNVNDLFTRPCP